MSRFDFARFGRAMAAQFLKLPAKSIFASAMVAGALSGPIQANAAPVSGAGGQQNQRVDPVEAGEGDFMSLSYNRVNMRSAPRQTALIQWTFVREGLPLLVTEAYENWRKVYDPDGASGWIREDMLGERRTVLVTERTRSMFDRPRPDARAIFQVEAGNVGSVRMCEGAWCKISVGSATGWILRTYLWGTFPGEDFDQ